MSSSPDAFEGSPEPSSKGAPGSEWPALPRRPWVPRVEGPADIREDARRSVSVRINTSDYGRVKAAAKALRVRESDIFRHLLAVGLEKLMRVLEVRVDPAQGARLLVETTREFARDFGMDVEETLKVLPPLNGRRASPLTDEDLDLLRIYATHPGHACSVLAARLGRAVAQEDLGTLLADYLQSRWDAAP